MEYTPHHHSVPPHDPYSVPTPPPPKESGFFAELFKFSLIALFIVLPIRLFVAQPFIVSGASMEPTFHTSEYLIVDQLTYHFEKPERGDVVIFKYPKDPSKYFIKRVIGLPGETIQIEGTSVIVRNDASPQGFILSESYIDDMSPSELITEVLGDDEYFVMGDNRNASSDSRAWGALPEENIVGRAFVRLFPFSEIGVMPGAHKSQSSLQE